MNGSGAGGALGYEELIDHDELRKDPTLAVLAASVLALGLRWLVLGGTKCAVAELQHSTIFRMRLIVGLTKRP